MDRTAGEPTILNDRYQVLRPLGHGGMGSVYLVYDRQTGHEVALKRFPPRARREDDLAHFEHEFLVLSRLRHPNVAEVHDFGVIEGSDEVFFTSECIDGQDLLAVTADLPEEEVAPLIVGVCRGLEYVHSREIIHYDVKPANVLVRGREPEGVKLIDFGLASRRVDDALGVIKGTVSYLAPEVVRHLPVDHRADLYSLGVTLFQCLTRQLPFRGETNLDVVRRIVSDPAPDPEELRPGISPGLKRLILRLMSREPGARFASGNEVIRALGRIYGRDWATEPRESTLTFVTTGAFLGRDADMKRLTGAFDRIFSWREPGEGGAPRGDDGSGSGSSFFTGSSSGFVLDDEGEDEEEPTRPAAGVAPPGPEVLQHVWLVSGELGVGKSRLMRELKTYAQLRRAAVVEGRASRAGGAYAAFVEVFRGVLGLWPAERAERDGPLRPRQSDPLRRRLLQRYGAELVRLIPELDSSALPVAPRPQLTPEQDELRLLDALAQFLIGYGRSRPLVLLLHDLDEGDPQTLELLRYLCRNLALIESARALAARSGRGGTPLRLMVVAGYRPSELEARGQDRLVAGIEQEPVTAAIRLEPLGPTEVHGLVESMLGVGSEPQALAERIYREARGNPYFTVELMRALVESGALVREGGRWRTQLDQVRLPDRVADAILERVRRTSAAEQGPLKLLAVLGRGATVHELSALLGKDARTVIARLNALERRQVLHSEVRGDARRYDFAHDLGRTAVYDTIPPPERLELHAACGQFLEKRADLGYGAVDVGELVRHFAAAGDRPRALEYGIRAGDEARAVHANQRAIRFYDDALSLLPAGQARWRDLLERTAELLALSGDYDRAAAAWEQLLGPTIEPHLTPVERVRAFRRRGEVLERRGDFEAALEALSQGTLHAFGQDGLEREAAALFAAAAGIYLRTGRYGDAVGFCETGLAQLAGLSEGEETAQLRTVLGRARLALGEPAEAEREFERCHAVRRRLGDEAGVARALADLGAVALASGRLEEARDRFERALERETALGHAAGIAEAAARLALACHALGEHERAVSLLRRALGIHEKTGDRAEVARTLVALGRLHARVGEVEPALEHLGRARRDSQALGLQATTAQALEAEAELLLELGDADGAAERATEALRQASLHGGAPRERAVALELLGAAALAREEQDPGEKLLHEAQALFRAQEDASGVLRTTVRVLGILVRRRDEALARATLAGLPPGPPADTDQARVTLARVEAALAFAHRITPAVVTELEQASAVAERALDRDLGWQLAACRGRVLDHLGQLDRALQAFVIAMTTIRDRVDALPEPMRERYLARPECVTCRQQFAKLRQRIDEAAGA